jgi:hypothetical protein
MLNDFLVLGLVPGTNLQITFNDLLIAIDIAVLVYMLFRKQGLISSFKYYYLYTILFVSVKKFKLFKLHPPAKLTERTN